MPEFLSDAWIEALDAQLASGSPGSAPVRTCIQYAIDVDGTVVEYHLVLGPDRDRAHRGRSDPPADVTFTMDVGTARQISDGELSTQEAFITGRLQLDGDPTLLIDAYRASGDDA